MTVVTSDQIAFLNYYHIITPAPSKKVTPNKTAQVKGTTGLEVTPQKGPL